MLIEDTWGKETGIASSYDKAYAVRGGLAGTNPKSTVNLGNDFKRFERVQAEILERQIKDMLINLISYKNMPPTLNTAQLETMLRQFGGGVCVGKDDFGDLVILGRADEVGYNAYGNVIPSLFDGSNAFLNNKRVITNRNLKGDYVVFYNKQSYTDFYSTDFEIVSHYCEMLAMIKATERMNLMQMRIPYFIKGKKDGVVGNDFAARYLSGDIFIKLDEGSDILDKVEKLDLNVPDRTNTCQASYKNTFSEMLTLFGVYNNPDAKKERMISQEASANNHIIEGMGDIYFNARRHAVDLINNAWGYDIEVEWNSTVASMFRNMAKKGGL